MKRIKRAVFAVLACGVVLAGVMVFRAWHVESMSPPAEPVEVSVKDPEGAVERLAEALQYRTVAPEAGDGDREPFVWLRDELERQFPTFHRRADRRLVDDLTLHFTLEGEDESAGHVVFLAHKDVVPVEEGTEQDWEHPPFSGTVDGGYIWGRGALDNKHNMMAMLEAADAWLADGAQPRHTMHFVFGHDEEIGGMDGARRVAERLEDEGVDVEAVYDEGLVITDGILPGVDEPIALVGIAERGVLNVEITAEAEGGHASMPSPELATGRLAGALNTLETTPMEAAVDGPVEKMFEAVVPHMDFPHRFVFRNLWVFEPLVLAQMADAPSTNAAVRTTAAPTRLSGGQRENVLPQQVSATVNFRIHPRDSIDDVLDYLDDRIADEHVTVEPVGRMRSEPSPTAPTDAQGFEALHTAFAEVFGDTPVAPGVLVGATDSRHFTGLTDAIYRFTPVVLNERDLDRIHGTNERIGIEAYLDLIRYYDRLFRQW